MNEKVIASGGGGGGGSQLSRTQMRGDRRMFSSSDDGVMLRQIQGTHTPDGREVDVEPVLKIIEDIFHRATPTIEGVINGTHGQLVEGEEIAAHAYAENMLDALAFVIQKVSCEISCKCSGGADAHGTTMAILHNLSTYSWDAKVVISLAAFAVTYGEFFLVILLYATNPLAKSIAILKQLPDIIENSAALKSRFDALKNLIAAMMDVTKCMVEFRSLPQQYISPENPPMSTAMAHIPTAAYWTIRSIVACACQIASLIGMSFEYIQSTTEAWELSSLAHKERNIHEHLMQQLRLCHHHIDEKRHIEAYHNLVRLFETPHIDNLRILKALICSKDDILPLVDGNSKKRVSIDVLRRKTVLLLISDLDISHEELIILDQIYKESRQRPEFQYEIVWLPIIEKSSSTTTPPTTTAVVVPQNSTLSESQEHKFEELRNMMSWYTIHHPSLLEPAVIRYIKEVWRFSKKQILVVLDPQGKVACPNALHMVWIWANLAYPFTANKEEALWKDETWRLELLVDDIDPNILEWMYQGKYICLYGGADIEWIQKFTQSARNVATQSGINLEMLYVGKSKARERVRKIMSMIQDNNLTHYWSDPTSVWYFWTRLECMLYSKMQHGKTAENDQIMQEVMTLLSFDGSDQGWAIIWIGSGEMARAKGDTMLQSFDGFSDWEDDARQRGFVPGLKTQLQNLHTPEHCNRLILPGIEGEIPEKVVCAECGKTMEKYFMYRCCTD